MTHTSKIFVFEVGNVFFLFSTPTGLITQKELQIFAERPTDVPWPLRRVSSGREAGEQVAAGVEAGIGVAVSVGLRELQVNALPSPGGVFSWKKVSQCTAGMAGTFSMCSSDTGTNGLYPTSTVSCERVDRTVRG